MSAPRPPEPTPEQIERLRNEGHVPLNPEHVAALAYRLPHHHGPNDECGRGCEVFRDAGARSILRAKTPAVHAALLDALVRAGYLSRAKELADLAAEFARHNGCSPREALDLLVAAMEAQR